MSVKALENLKEMLCEELETIAKKKEMSAGDLEAAHKLTDTIKNIEKITMLQEGGYSGYSGYGGGSSNSSYRGGGYSRDDGGGSGGGSGYSGRAGHYVRGHYSRDEGRHHLIDRMESMLYEVDSEEDRAAIQRCINQLR